MNTYRLSELAELDLEDIWVYITGQNPLASDKQIAQILNHLVLFQRTLVISMGVFNPMRV